MVGSFSKTVVTFEANPLLKQVDWSVRCGDSCGICVTAETPQTQVEEASARPAESGASCSGNQPLVQTATKLTKTAFLKDRRYLNKLSGQIHC
ncbi:hypothetical protein SAMN05443252_101536 [Bacillus sp. OV322]|nr:hypothetical protein SAMN05443252_101536 [Bacillus sp. OV322]